jgi:endonuclease YncB( thermonuclease family)
VAASWCKGLRASAHLFLLSCSWARAPCQGGYAMPPNPQRSLTLKSIPLLLLVAALHASIASAETITGRVVGVADGDTITVLDSSKTQHKIRLTGIDAPEKKQAFGQRSKESLSDLVFSREVAVETTKVDRYGRELGKVLVDGVDANLEQIRRGLAWHYKSYQRDQSPADRAAYAQAEEQAREARKGLWADSQPVPPWEFRHGPK